MFKLCVKKRCLETTDKNVTAGGTELFETVVLKEEPVGELI